VIGRHHACSFILCAGLLLGLLDGGSAFAAEKKLTLHLVDPARQSEVVLEPGSTALHLVFFATWCPSCVDELDGLADLQARWEERGYRLVLIAVHTRQSAERLVRFSAERHPPGELLLDSGGVAAATLGAKSLPTHLLLNEEGEVILRASALDAGLVQSIEKLMRDEDREQRK
jgi:thiol-disulfide isomerase/thioredoxin